MPVPLPIVIALLLVQLVEDVLARFGQNALVEWLHIAVVPLEGGAYTAV